MLFAIVAALLFPAAIMAMPAQKPAAGDDKCAPVSYIVSEYSLAKSASYAFVSFNVQSTYQIDARQSDAVEAGVNCETDGPELRNNNECNIAGKRTNNLIFDLRGSSNDAKYRITHLWKCNDATWKSTNDIELPPLDCDTVKDDKDVDTLACHATPFIFTPQNVRKLSDDNSKKAGDKANVAVKPTTKSSL